MKQTLIIIATITATMSHEIMCMEKSSDKKYEEAYQQHVRQNIDAWLDTQSVELHTHLGVDGMTYEDSLQLHQREEACRKADFIEQIKKLKK